MLTLTFLNNIRRKQGFGGVQELRDAVNQLQNLEEQIKLKWFSLSSLKLILDFSLPKVVTKVKQQIQKIKDESKQFPTEEQIHRKIGKDEKAKGDAIYWAIYNLDLKNPNNQRDFEHLPPEQLVTDILEKDRRVAEIMSEIKAILEQ